MKNKLLNQVQGETRVETETDLSPYQIGFNNAGTQLELIVHDKIITTNYYHFPSLERLDDVGSGGAFTISESSAGASVIGVDNSEWSEITATNLQDVLTEIDAALVSSSGLTIGDPISGGTAGRILYEDSSNQLAESANLQFDGTSLTISNDLEDTILTVQTSKEDGVSSIDLKNDVQTWRIKCDENDFFQIYDVTNSTEIFKIDNLYWETSVGNYTFHTLSGITTPLIFVGDDAWDALRDSTRDGGINLTKTIPDVYIESTFTNYISGVELGHIYFTATKQDELHRKLVELTYCADSTGTPGQTGGILKILIKKNAIDSDSMFEVCSFQETGVYVGDDLLLNSDGAILSMGADSEITWTHVHDVGVTFNGNLGIGEVASSAIHLYVNNQALSTDATYYGIFNRHAKTAGASDVNDDLAGIWNVASFDQNGY